MKKISALFIGIIMLLALSNNINAQIDSCKKMICPIDANLGWHNPDSLLVDSCSQGFEEYSKQWFKILLPFGALKTPIYDYDTIIVDRTWEDIDTSFVLLRQKFQQLDSIAGSFIFRKEAPHYSDTIHPASRCFLIKFDNVVNIQNILDFLKDIPGVEGAYYRYRAGKLLSSFRNEPGFEEGYKKIDESKIRPLFRTGSKEYFHPNSFQWNLYSMHTPMAWEITKGNNSIYITFLDSPYPENGWGNQNKDLGFGIGDGFGQSPPITNYIDDFYFRINEREDINSKTNYTYGNTADGNIIYNWFKNSHNIDWGEGTEPNHIRLTGPSHGMQCLALAISKQNGRGITGIAPNCKAVCVDIGVDYGKIDIDCLQNGIQFPTVCSASNKNLGNLQMYKDKNGPFDKGIPLINTHDGGGVLIPISEAVLNIEGFIEASDGNNFKIELKSINVMPLFSQSSSGNCVPWDPRYDPNDKSGNFFTTSMEEKWFDFDQINSPFCFSKANGKYYKTGKMDIFGVSARFVPYDEGKFSDVDASPSYSIPYISGTVALMKSIDINLGCAEISGAVTAPFKIINKAYDIVTFTADKIPCLGEYYYNDPYNTFNDGYYNKGYNRQIDKENNLDYPVDPLDRWWSPQYAYGKINSFRCVAHAIRNIGKEPSGSNPQTYTTNDNLLFVEYPSAEENYPLSRNEGYYKDGRKLLHLGAYNQNGEPVLEKGGNKYDDEMDWDNCWGTTIINGDGTNLQVGSNCLLAIDAILKQEQEPLKYNKITTSGNGKILMTGFLKNILLEGRLKLDDVRVFSPGENNFTGAIKTSGSSGTYSELYHQLQLNDNSKLTVSSGTFITQPSATIAMNGTQDIEINTGATLWMAYNSHILDLTPNTERKIIIKPGGKLVIEEGAMVHLDCEVEIQGTEQSRGEMIFEKNTLAYCNKIILTEFGKLTLNEDAIILPETGKTGKVVIQPGAELKIENQLPNDAPIAILGGVDVYGGWTQALPPVLKVGKLTVAENAKLHIGPMNSTSHTVIEFKAGSQTTLFASNTYGVASKLMGVGIANSYIGGQLTISSAAISSFEGEYKYECNTLGNDGFVYATFNLNRDLNPPSATSDYLNISQSQFENVGFKLIDAIKNPIVNCTFNVNSGNLKKFLDDANLSEYKPYFEKLKFPLSILYFKNGLWIPTYTVPDNPADNLTISNCTFKDLSSIKAWDDQPYDNPPNKYHFIAVNANNHWNVNIIGDSDPQTKEFQNIKTGVMTGLCSRVNVQGINFDNCYVGTADDGSSVSLCSNKFNWVKTGSEFGRSMLWKTYNNTYNVTYHAVAIDNDAAEIFRGNSFIEYFNGIHNFRGSAILSDNFFPQFAEQISRPKLGRNLFKVTKPSTFYHNITSPFYSVTGSPLDYDPEHSDIWLQNIDSKVYLYCGRNEMAAWSKNHLWSELQQSDNIQCDFNKYNHKYDDNETPVFQFRKNDNIIDNPTIIWESEILNLNCEQEEYLQYCWINLGSCDYFAHNDGNLPEISPDSIYLDNMFWRSYNDFCFGVLNCECMKIKLQDALQAATLGDSTQQKLQLLKDCLENFLNDPNSPNCPPHPLRMILGEINERLNMPVAALSNYNYILSNNPEPLDTMYAKWRIDYLNAIVSDTTHGFIFDSLMSVFHSRYITDITRSDTTGHYSPKRAMPDSLDIEIANMPPDTLGIKLDQNQPNPFVYLTEIQYFLSQQVPVKLVLYDYNGREIAVLIDKYIKPGWHSLIVNGSGLTQGAYILTLKAVGKTVSKTIHRRD